MSDIIKDIMEMSTGIIIQFLAGFQLIHIIVIMIRRGKVYDGKYKGNMTRNMKMITQMTIQALSYF